MRPLEGHRLPYAILMEDHLVGLPCRDVEGADLARQGILAGYLPPFPTSAQAQDPALEPLHCAMDHAACAGIHRSLAHAGHIPWLLRTIPVECNVVAGVQGRPLSRCALSRGAFTRLPSERRQQALRPL